ncbi:hypothetical protein [Mameliella sp.]
MALSLLAATQAQAQSIDLTQVVKTQKQNPMRFESEYKGRGIGGVGVLKSMREEVWGDGWVVMFDGYVYPIECTFNLYDSTKLLDKDIGDDVPFFGEIYGIGGFMEDNIQLVNCTVTE